MHADLALPRHRPTCPRRSEWARRILTRTGDVRSHQESNDRKYTCNDPMSEKSRVLREGQLVEATET